jgi:hypothetical protein
MTHQQCNAKVFFDLADLHAERGLRHMQLLGGTGHIAGINHLYEILELPQIHGESRVRFSGAKGCEGYFTNPMRLAASM